MDTPKPAPPSVSAWARAQAVERGTKVPLRLGESQAKGLRISAGDTTRLPDAANRALKSNSSMLATESLTPTASATRPTTAQTTTSRHNMGPLQQGHPPSSGSRPQDPQRVINNVML